MVDSRLKVQQAQSRNKYKLNEWINTQLSQGDGTITLLIHQTEFRDKE